MAPQWQTLWSLQVLALMPQRWATMLCRSEAWIALWHQQQALRSSVLLASRLVETISSQSMLRWKVSLGAVAHNIGNLIHRRLILAPWPWIPIPAPTRPYEVKPWTNQAIAMIWFDWSRTPYFLWKEQSFINRVSIFHHFCFVVLGLATIAAGNNVISLSATLAAINPTSGSTQGCTQVTITGTGFF